MVEDLLRRLIEIRRELGITILIVEQSATVALEIADYGYVMENGRIVLDGTAERLRSHPDIQEFYLGPKQRRAPELPRREAVSPQPEMVWLSSRSIASRCASAASPCSTACRSRSRPASCSR